MTDIDPDTEPEIPINVTCIVTHDGCHDGYTAQWLLQRQWPDAYYYPGIYGEPGPEAKAGALGSTLIIADFSYPRDEMIRLAGLWSRIIVLDHHQTAQTNLVDLPPTRADLPIRVKLDMNRSGAGLVADWLDVRLAAPLVDYIEDRDLWRWALPDSREIAAVFSATPHTSEAWDMLNVGIRQHRSILVDQGRLVIARDNIIIEELVAVARPMTIGGHTVPVVPSPYAVGSETAGRLAVGQPFAAYYRDLPDRREFGLRSDDDGLDVAVIAETYGGGGHQHASGFRVPWGHELAPN